MQTSLIITTFMMGIAGGPHCIAMCGAACGGLQKNSASMNIWQFHLGRILGYTMLGAVAASSIGTLAWFSGETQSLKPLWTFFHALVMAWGLVLLLYARQPLWVDRTAKRIWQKVTQFATVSKGGGLFTGMLWALMPCGLLYSALMIASLNPNPVNGALCMASFAFATSISLLIGPWLWFKLKQNLFHWFGQDLSMRLAGLLLVGVAAWALWMDMVHQTKVWCN